MTSAFNAEARKLVALSLDAGVVSPERVRAVLDTLAATRKPAKLRPILKAYYVALRREIARGEARIEYAGSLAAETPAIIAAHFSKIYGRPIMSVAGENDALVAGIRVRVADDVYDASARGILERLAGNLSK